MTHKINARDCAFCGKKPEEVHKMIPGPDVSICDECVQLCLEIIEEEPEPQAYCDVFKSG